MQYYFLVRILKNNRFYREKASSRQSDLTDTSVGRVEDCSGRSKFDSNHYVAAPNPAQWMHYYLLLTILKNSRSYREEASSPYSHFHKRDSTDSSVGRAEDCSARSKI